jgi:hypothetical protein
MDYKGKTHLNYVIVVPPELEGEADRIFKSHAAWMESTHHRSGESALHQYVVSKAPELSNPFDPSSEPTGNVCFILDEVYETDAGVSDHFQMAMSGWSEFPALGELLGKAEVRGAPAARVFNSLW